MDAVLLESARRGGIDAAARYSRLIIAAMTAVGADPRSMIRVGLVRNRRRIVRMILGPIHRVV
jgi:hypothetical protein